MTAASIGAPAHADQRSEKRGAERFAQIPESWLSLDLSLQEWRVAIALMAHGPHDIYPKFDTLAEITGMHRRKVIAAIKKLEEKRVFRVDRGAGPNNGKGPTNRYTPLYQGRTGVTNSVTTSGVTELVTAGVPDSGRLVVTESVTQTDQATDQVTDHLSPAAADDAVGVAEAENTGETNATSPIADVLPLGIETARGGGASPRNKRPKLDKPAKPVREDKRTDAEKSADAAMQLLLARIKPYLHGMTVTTWRKHNRRVVVDMVQAGMSVDEIDAAHDEIRDGSGKPFIVMDYFQKKLATQALRPAPPAVVTGLDLLTDKQREAITRKELARRAAAGESDSDLDDAPRPKQYPKGYIPPVDFNKAMR